MTKISVDWKFKIEGVVRSGTLFIDANDADVICMENEASYVKDNFHKMVETRLRSMLPA